MVVRERTTGLGTPSTVAEAYAHCLRLARSHYENFPVASRLLPARLRPAVAAIYAYARQADDIADEGDDDAAARLAKLEAYARQLQRALAAERCEEPVLIALAHAVRTHRLPVEPLHHLLLAFRADITRKRYATFEELADYCRHSANPIGRLLLHLYGRTEAEDLRCSDAICSALQLVNFLQDLEQDYVENGRIYLPQEEMGRFGVAEEHFRDRRSDGALKALLRLQIGRARSGLLAGRPLCRRLPWRAGLELSLLIAAALLVLERLEQREACFARPRLARRDWPRVALRALFS